MTYQEEIQNKILSQEIIKPCCKKSFLNAFLYSSATWNTDRNCIDLSLSGKTIPEFLNSYIQEQTGKYPEIRSRRGRGAVLLSYHSNSAKEFLLKKQKDFFPWNDFKCKECSKHFLRGLYLSSGYITNPDQMFRLDFIPTYHAREMTQFFESLGLNSHITSRRGKEILYFRSSESISDVFANMGLMDVYFDLQNEYFKKQLNNYTNRQNNCTLSNINKSVKAQSDILKLLKVAEKKGQITLLPEELQETAILRLKYPDYTLSQLSSMSVPFISKSGLNHRLKKIEAILQEKYKK